MKEPPCELKELIRELRLNKPAAYPLFLSFDGCRMAVFFSDPELRATLSEYFRTFLAPAGPEPDIAITVHEMAPAELALPFLTFVPKAPEPGKLKIKEEFCDLGQGRVVRKRLTGMHFLFTPKQHLAAGPCQANPNQVVNFINNRFIQWKLDRGCLLGHAAAVLHNNRGLALAGFSGMGKSTLALHLLSEGARFVSNDRLLVESAGDGCRMSGVAKLPRVNPGTVLNNEDLREVIPDEERCRFHSLAADELWHLEHKFDVDIEACFGPDKFTLSGPLHGLAILNWQRGHAPLVCRQVNLAARPELLPAFMKETGLFYLGGKDDQVRFGPERYRALLAHVPVFEFSGGADFARAADRCLDFLNGLAWAGAA